MTINGSGKSVIGAPTKNDCDLVLMSGGWNPAVHLFSQSTGKLRYDDALACFVPNISMQAEPRRGPARRPSPWPAVWTKEPLPEPKPPRRRAMARARFRRPPPVPTIFL